MTPTYAIEFIGGPLDGETQLSSVLPKDGSEFLYATHSYTFNFTEWQYDYRGRWRHIEIGNSLVTYRTFAEAVRQLGQLQFTGVISASESLDYQARIKGELYLHGRI